MPTSPAYAGGGCRRCPGSGRRSRPAASSSRRSAAAPAHACARPAAAAGDHERPLRRQQQLAQRAQRPGAARPAPARRAAAAAPRSAARSMSSGSTSTTGPGPALHRGVRRRAPRIRGCGRRRRCARPTWPALACWGRKSGGSRPPGRPRGRAGRWRPRRRTAPSASNPGTRCARRSRRWWRPGPRVTKQMPGRPVSLPCASAMKAAPPSCRLMMKRMWSRCSWKPSSTARIALARHAEGVVDALRDQASTRACPAERGAAGWRGAIRLECAGRDSRGIAQGCLTLLTVW